MSIFLAILFGVGCVVCTGFAFLYDGDSTAMRIGSAVIAAVLLICFALIPFSIHSVNTGEVAVVKVFGEAKEVKSAGLHFGFWISTKYDLYDTKIQNLDIETLSYSSDAQTMDVSMTVQYQIDSDKVLEIAENFGSLELLQAKIERIVVEQTKAVLSEHKAMDIIANRAAMSPMVEEAVKKAIGSKYFVSISTVVLTDIEFSEAFEAAVENKMIAEQQLLKSEYENQTKIEKAEANAKVKLLNAEAEKKANDLLQKSLTEEILREKWINKWNGKLPQVTSDSDLIYGLSK